MRKVVLCLVVGSSACAESTSDSPELRGEDCNVEAVVDEATSMIDDIFECGRVVLEDDLEEWQTAHQCAADALDRGVPMQLIFQPSALDSASVNAFLRPSNDADVRFYYYSSVLNGGAWVLSYGCPDVVSIADCNVEVGQICLECTEGSPEVKECVE